MTVNIIKPGKYETVWGASWEMNRWYLMSGGGSVACFPRWNTEQEYTGWADGIHAQIAEAALLANASTPLSATEMAE